MDPFDYVDGDEGRGSSVADGAGSDLSHETGHRGGGDYYSLPGWTGIDCLDVIEGLGLNFHLGNVLKYVWRAGRKSPDRLKDLLKAREYLDREITRLRTR